MMYRFRRMVLSFLIGVTAGCVPTPSPPPAANAPPSFAPQPVPVAVPSNQAPAIWNQGQVEQWLKQELKLTELRLSGDGNYMGEGRDASGKAYQLKVTQVPGGIACEHTSGPGNSGRIAFGNKVPSPGDPAPGAAPTESPASVQIPDRPVAGRIHGRDFTLAKALLENGVLTLRQGKDLAPDLALDVMLFIKQGEPAEGKKLQVAADQAPGKPILRLQWREPGKGSQEFEDFTNNYLLVLEFGRLQDGKLPGRIHASFPDAAKSWLSGTFALEGVR